MSFIQAQTAYGEAGAAIRVKDYSTAIDRLLEAQSYLAAVPDSGRSGNTVTFGRELDALLQSVREREQAARIKSVGGMQRTRVEYVRPRSHDGWC